MAGNPLDELGTALAEVQALTLALADQAAGPLSVATTPEVAARIRAAATRVRARLEATSATPAARISAPVLGNPAAATGPGKAGTK